MSRFTKIVIGLHVTAILLNIYQFKSVIELRKRSIRPRGFQIPYVGEAQRGFDR
jgi:hypothetical protein